MKQKKLSFYKKLHSTSEHKIRVFGKDTKELFTNALKAMFLSMDPQKKSKNEIIKHTFNVSGIDKESLLVNLLSEALYFSSVNNESYDNINFIVFDEKEAKGELIGFKISSFGGGEIKAVTHHGLKIISSKGLLQVDILFDI